jgi:hypothetical protein
VEEFESCRSGRHSVDNVGYLLRLLLVERHRHESYDTVEVVEGHWSQRLWCGVNVKSSIHWMSIAATDKRRSKAKMGVSV